MTLYSPGHYQRVSLSPVSAIADMVAPVVMITLAAFLSNGLLTAGITNAGWVLALDRERYGILRGPHGEMLGEGSVPPADRERLTQIRTDTLQITRRIQHLRTAVLVIWIAIGLLVLGVAAIAAAVTARSEALGFTALALVLAGVAVVFISMAMVVVWGERRSEALIGRTGHGVLDLVGPASASGSSARDHAADTSPSGVAGELRSCHLYLLRDIVSTACARRSMATATAWMAATCAPATASWALSTSSG